MEVEETCYHQNILKKLDDTGTATRAIHQELSILLLLEVFPDHDSNPEQSSVYNHKLFIHHLTHQSIHVQRKDQSRHMAEKYKDANYK
jgi:hypothetical protein